MKKLLLSAMILCSVHSNAMENEDAHTQRAKQLHQFYLREAEKKPILKEIKLVVTPSKRIAFFAGLVAKNSKIGDNRAMYHLICATATVIIKSRHYSSESPSFYVVEALDPIARSYLIASQEEMVR